MKVNVNVKRTFKINGKEYSSIEEMPDDLRETFKKAMAAQAASGQQADAAAGRTKIVFNGAHYESLDAMPQDERRLYEKILKSAATGSVAPEIDLADIAGGLRKEQAISAASYADATAQPTKFEPAFSKRTLTVIFMLGGLLLLLYLLWQSK